MKCCNTPVKESCAHTYQHLVTCGIGLSLLAACLKVTPDSSAHKAQSPRGQQGAAQVALELSVGGRCLTRCCVGAHPVGGQWVLC